jgi:hypothetical protein
MTNSFETGFLRDTSTYVLALTTDATGATWQEGFLRAPTGDLVVTTDTTGATWQSGFLRAPSGALVVEQDGAGTFETGFARTASGALDVTQNTSGADWEAGFIRDASGLLVVAGLTAPFATDTFTGAALTDLSAHTADTGQSWVEHPVYASGALVITDANRLRCSAGVGGYYLNAAPATAEYDVACDFVVLSSTGMFAGPTARMDTTANTFYHVRFNSTNGVWELFKFVAGVSTSLGQGPAFTYTVGQTYNVKLQIRDAAKKVIVDGVEQVSSADNVITAAGFAGIRWSSGNTNSTGTHFDNYTVTNA